VLVAAADKEHLDREQVERVEQRRSGLARLLDDFATGGAFEDTLRGLIRQAVVETADSGQVVIVAHAASQALTDRDNVLRVLVTASPDTRAKRLLASESISERQAQKTIHDSDRSRADYLARFYAIDQELPTQYDLVINTDRLDTEQVAALVIQAARK
jgi:cytidylate kinase